uniref:3-deoxy-7-phosphoheptulonate synthase n=1 Tax=Albugo laibachii Nc14 TaxID=890382 RepID=F0WVS0_9STRA|nr:phospho2dehydro3deoxyheptonate aldolase putative [Albugo laibachii Nc14]|eukprot:CCA25516.1 phospho2dehydro3deoxyheptonate aldolase putative [Albugo laibachii Nc14]
MQNSGAKSTIELQTATMGRQGVTNILCRTDDRLIAVVGPCSIHDVEAAVDYTKRLADLENELRDDLLIIMRAYFENARTTVG